MSRPRSHVYSTLSKGPPGGVNLRSAVRSVRALLLLRQGTGPTTSQPPSYYARTASGARSGREVPFADRGFTVNADVFYVKWHNIQQLIVLSCGYPYNTKWAIQN